MTSEYEFRKDCDQGLNYSGVYRIHNGIALEDLVNTKVLNSIQEKFTRVTGVRCLITNHEGTPLTNIQSFTKFCQLIRSIPEGRRRCEEWDRIKSLEAARKGEAVVYTCHAGLIDAALPIVVNNQHIGSFLCGQVILPQNGLDYEEIKEKVKDFNIDEKLLYEYLDEIEVVSEEKLIAALEMLTLVSNYIVEMGVTNITQKQLMNEMKSKSELEHLLRETEYKALQAQINPHFLFNCLNTISLVALTEGASQTQELIYAISDILRSLLKHSEKIISVKEEIKYVQDYLAIQQARFGDRIRVVYNISDDVLNARLPKFTLQPLVENAIVHGLEPLKKGGTLTINAIKDDNNNLVIEITDTGVGIEKTVMNVLLKVRSGDGKDNIIGLGINNVNERIQYYFGVKYGLKIDSNPGEGCKVTVTVPHLKS